MQRKLSMCARVFFVFAFLAGFCFAQTQTARLVGTVKDATGALVPNAKISAVHNETKTRTDTTGNASGDFVLPALQPGTYTLNVEAAGFRKAVISDITLDVAAEVAENVILEVGQLTETVEVKANTLAVQTTESEVSQVVTISDIATLPQIARTPITLAVFQPGVQIFPQANGSSSGADYSFAHVNGLREGSNNNTLDGIDVNDSVAPRIGLSLTANNTDSVEEARMLTDGGKAEYGRSAGAQLQLITRSGTNQYHGNAFDYLRNRDLNANDFFNNGAGVPIPVLIQNLYGGSFGGPIKHNKLFIFGNYQGRRTHAQAIQNTVVPTATALQGIYSWIPPGSTTVQQYSIVNADPLHKGIDPTVAALLKLYPAPNNNTNCSGTDGLNSSCYTFNFPNGSLEDQFTIKADYNLTSSMHIFERTSWQRNSAVDSLNGAQNVIPGQPAGTQGGRRWGVAGGWDWTISPTMVNEFRYGHQSATVAFNRPEREDGPMVSFNTWTTPILTAFPQGRNSPVNEYTDNLTKIHGNHTFKFGGQVRFTDQYGYNAAGIYPNISLSTANSNVPPTSVNPPGSISSANLSIFQGMYNDLLGRISSVTETYYSNLQQWQAAGTPRVRNFIFHEYGFFAQDDWRVTRHLTLNLGLRWEFFPVPYDTNGQQGIITPSNVLNMAGQSSTLTVQQSGQWWANNWTNFAPRFGLAWDPWGDGKTSIRGGFGIFNDRIIGAATSSIDGATPGFSQGVTLYPNSTSGSDVRIGTAPPLPAQPAAPLLTPAATRQTALDATVPNLKTGYVMQWNLNIQRQIARGTLLDVGYVANRGVKLFYETNLDQSHIYSNGFLTAFNQIASNLTNLAAVPASNPLVQIYGSAATAVSTIGSTVFSTGQVGTAANTTEVNNYTKYAAAGISPYFIRNFPQLSTLLLGTNDGRSEYNSLQVRLTHQFAALRVAGNYTWSKSIDNDQSTATGGEGNGFAAPIDSFNEALARGRSNFDIPHALTASALYQLPIGKGQMLGRTMPSWVDTLIGGWNLGGLWILESGSPFTVSSGRATGPSTAATWGDFTGSRDIGSVMTSNNGTGPGVYYFTPTEIASFAFPAAGTIGSSGRNTFRGPGFLNIDASLVKRFVIMEKKALTFRAEAYNLINHPDFANPALSLATPATFGKITALVNNPRIVQMALRFDF
jgi:hypothetical protein